MTTCDVKTCKASSIHLAGNWLLHLRPDSMAVQSCSANKSTFEILLKNLLIESTDALVNVTEFGETVKLTNSATTSADDPKGWLELRVIEPEMSNISSEVGQKFQLNMTDYGHPNKSISFGVVPELEFDILNNHAHVPTLKATDYDNRVYEEHTFKEPVRLIINVECDNGATALYAKEAVVQVGMIYDTTDC